MAEADRALLAVQHFKAAVRVLHPIHHIQGEALADGIQHRVALFGVVDEFALVLGPDVEPAAVPQHAFLGVIHVALGDFADADFFQFNFHWTAPFLRMRILKYGGFPLTTKSLSSFPFRNLIISNWSGLYLSRKVMGTPIAPS